MPNKKSPGALGDAGAPNEDHACVLIDIEDSRPLTSQQVRAKLIRMRQCARFDAARIDCILVALDIGIFTPDVAADLADLADEPAWPASLIEAALAWRARHYGRGAA